MSKEPRVPLPPPIEETVSMHHYSHVEDTQPTSGAAPLPAHMPLRAGQRRRRSRLFLLLPVLLLLVSLAGGLAAGGYALWRWTGTLPRTNLLILVTPCIVTDVDEALRLRKALEDKTRLGQPAADMSLQSPGGD